MSWSRAKGTLVGCVGLLVVGVACAPAPQPDLGEATIVYLVRHAERAEDGSNDPPLSEMGLDRAQALVHVLGDAGIERVFSTDYRRTRLTADPLATALGVTVDAYDPRDLPAFAEQLKAMRGARVVVAGHSNTTPELVVLLGGDAVREMPEWEYDRLYVVLLEPSGAVRSTLLRYGTLSTDPNEMAQRPQGMAHTTDRR